MDYRDVLRMIEEGEGFEIEFKRKVSTPEKIARAMIAFANTRGGSILFGVDDDGSIVGVESEKSEADQRTLELETHIEVAAFVALPRIGAALIERCGQEWLSAHAAWHAEQRPLASIMVRRIAKPSRLAASVRSTRAWPAIRCVMVAFQCIWWAIIDRAAAEGPRGGLPQEL